MFRLLLLIAAATASSSSSSSSLASASASASASTSSVSARSRVQNLPSTELSQSTLSTPSTPFDEHQNEPSSQNNSPWNPTNRQIQDEEGNSDNNPNNSDVDENNENHENDDEEHHDNLWSTAILQQSLQYQNPFVASSPLSVAAVCRDGIALVSLHFGLDDADVSDGDDNDYVGDGDVGDDVVGDVGDVDNGDDAEEEEKGRNDSETANVKMNEIAKMAGSSESQPHPLMRIFRDLPMSSRGPLRIEGVYQHPWLTKSTQSTQSTQSTPPLATTSELSSTLPPLPPPTMAIQTAGWRTDGRTLADAARELMMEETSLYCLPSVMLDGDYGGGGGGNGGSNDVGGGGSTLDGSDGGSGNRGRPIEPMEPMEVIEDSPHDTGSTDKNESIRESTARTIVPPGVPPVAQPRAQPAVQPIVQPVIQPYYARRIAEGLSYYLAKCSFSEGVRSLSCVGLLACSGPVVSTINTGDTHCTGDAYSTGDSRIVGDSTGQRGASMTSMGSIRREGSIPRGAGGSLYLIDATSTHRVRAHAIGHGAAFLHKRMAFVDFEKMGCREGLRVLLGLIAEEGGMGGKFMEGGELSISGEGGKAISSGEKEMEKMEEMEDEVVGGDLLEDTSSNSKPAFVTSIQSKSVSLPKNDNDANGAHSAKTGAWNLPSKAAVELAMLRSGDGKMRRVRLSSLLK